VCPWLPNGQYFQSAPPLSPAYCTQILHIVRRERNNRTRCARLRRTLARQPWHCLALAPFDTPIVRRGRPSRCSKGDQITNCFRIRSAVFLRFCAVSVFLLRAGPMTGKYQRIPNFADNESRPYRKNPKARSATARTATAGSGREIEVASEKPIRGNVLLRLARARLELSPTRVGRRIDPVS
jgi:hypothetical protein